MPVDSSTNILTLSNTQAKELAGRIVIIGGATYSFKSYDPDHPGQPPWRSGAEGKAYPLLGNDGSRGRLPEVLHPPHADAARSDRLADRAANAHLAAQSCRGARALDRHPAWPPRRKNRLPVCRLPGEGRSRRDLAGAARAASPAARRDSPKTSAGAASRTCSWPWLCWNRRNSCMATCRRTTWSSIWTPRMTIRRCT